MRYRRSVLGMVWTLLHPIAMTAVLCAVFGTTFEIDVWEYAPFLLAGLSFWSFVTYMTSHGSQSFYLGASYIRQHPAPMAIYPLRIALAGAFHFLLALAIVVVFVGCLFGVTNLASWLTLLPTLALLFAIGWSVATLVGLANVYYRDVEHLCEVVLRIAFYLTPVMYPPSVLRGARLGWLNDYNPLAACLHLIREPILVGRSPSIAAFVLVSTCAVTLACAAMLALWRHQPRLAQYL